MITHDETDIAVVGAGPAGLMAAIAAAQLGRRVCIIEQMSRPGLKLLATGGGRCNLTNELSESDFMSAFGRQGRFIQPALAAIDQAALRDFMGGIGVPTTVEEGGLVYPASHKAGDVLSAMWRRCEKLGVARRLSTEVAGLVTAGSAAGDPQASKTFIVGIQTSSGHIACRCVILACGGKSYPDLGATGSGYGLAEACGHSIIQPCPALTPLVAKDRWLARCAGVSLSNVRIWIDLPKQGKTGRTGDILFTHTGLSGPAVLDLSGDVVDLLESRQQVPLRLDLTGSFRTPLRGSVQGAIDDWAHRQGGRQILTLLSSWLPQSLATEVSRLAGADPVTPASQLSRGQRDDLAAMLTRLPLTITAYGGFDKAIVTRGGVSLKHVDPHTLASRLVDGLYFAGEILDLDGPCGGFNLQWAFSSGHLAGLCAARRLITQSTEGLEA